MKITDYTYNILGMDALDVYQNTTYVINELTEAGFDKEKIADFIEDVYKYAETNWYNSY